MVLFVTLCISDVQTIGFPFLHGWLRRHQEVDSSDDAEDLTVYSASPRRKSARKHRPSLERRNTSRILKERAYSQDEAAMGRVKLQSLSRKHEMVSSVESGGGEGQQQHQGSPNRAPSTGDLSWTQHTDSLMDKKINRMVENMLRSGDFPRDTDSAPASTFSVSNRSGMERTELGTELGLTKRDRPAPADERQAPSGGARP
eukprot:SAG11_NODE_13731_length_642_cov_0.847145_1_plen_201_part_00